MQPCANCGQRHSLVEQSVVSSHVIVNHITSMKINKNWTNNKSRVILSKILTTRKADLEYFPAKGHSAAMNKINIPLSCVVKGICMYGRTTNDKALPTARRANWPALPDAMRPHCCRSRGAPGDGQLPENKCWPKCEECCKGSDVGANGRVVCAEFISLAPPGLNNDAAAALLMWYCGEVAAGRERVAARIVNNFNDTAALKSMSDAIKSAGSPTVDNWLLNYVELVTMHGRGVGTVDLAADAARRCGTAGVMTAVNVDPSKLRQAIRSIYGCCLRRRPVIKDASEYWADRWAFTKSGAHSRAAEQVTTGTVTTKPQATRREFAEAVAGCPLLIAEPMIVAVPSLKLEHGKTRALYNCDTVSYYHFDAVLKAVEACWDSTSVKLDPQGASREDDYSMYSSISGVRVMLDYDDFNSQHSLDAMIAVFEELRPYVDGDSRLLDWCIRAQHRQLILSAGVATAISGTLFSGHRATTFINTVLNAAYFAMTGVDTIAAFHAGDDVLLYTRSMCEANAAVAALQSFGFRLNASKQSCGTLSGEFLRCVFCPDGARGYVARALSSLVSGNWVSDKQLSPGEYILVLKRAAWTVALRGGYDVRGPLTASLLWRHQNLSHGVASELMDYTTSVNNSPAAHSLFNNPHYSVTATESEMNRRPYGSSATCDYIKHNLNTRVLHVLGLQPSELPRPMLKVSFGCEERLFGRLTARCVTRAASMPVATTVLRSLPKLLDARELWPMNLFPGRFTPMQMMSAAMILGHEPRCVTCVGTQPVIALGIVCWADAEALGTRINAPVTTVASYKVYM